MTTGHGWLHVTSAITFPVSPDHRAQHAGRGRRRGGQLACQARAERRYRSLLDYAELAVGSGAAQRAVEFDVRAFKWIGNTTDSPNVITVWSATGIRTIEDAKQREVVLGASGAGSASYIILRR